MSHEHLPVTLSLSLVSHTNVGKTTLARTLLGRDVGEVRDAPHVTEFADVYTMIETPQGERLRLWDTPGFGDSVRLARRLRERSNPLGWFISEVWDRWRDRPLWSSQQALRNVRDEADVMLYLVNAAESPEAAGYVEHEMALLRWVGKPVIVLLNQLGAPREAALEEADLALIMVIRHAATGSIEHSRGRSSCPGVGRVGGRACGPARLRAQKDRCHECITVPPRRLVVGRPRAPRPSPAGNLHDGPLGKQSSDRQGIGKL